jgi:hypothetical protein
MIRNWKTASSPSYAGTRYWMGRMRNWKTASSPSSAHRIYRRIIKRLEMLCQDQVLDGEDAELE